MGGEHYGPGRARVVISYDTPDLEGEPVILASNRTHWEERREAQCYLLRFRVDNFYRDVKQNLGLGEALPRHAERR